MLKNATLKEKKSFEKPDGPTLWPTDNEPVDNQVSLLFLFKKNSGSDQLPSSPGYHSWLKKG